MYFYAKELRQKTIVLTPLTSLTPELEYFILRFQRVT